MAPPTGPFSICSELSSVAQTYHSCEVPDSTPADVADFSQGFTTHLTYATVQTSFKHGKFQNKVLLDLRKFVERYSNYFPSFLYLLSDIDSTKQDSLVGGIINSKDNAWLLPYLWNQTFYGEYDEIHSPDEAKIQALLAFVNQKPTGPNAKSPSGGSIEDYPADCKLSWYIPSDMLDKHIVIENAPLSFFDKVIEHHKKQDGRGFITQVESLSSCYGILNNKNDLLAQAIKQFNEKNKPYMTTASIVSSAENYLQTMINHPTDLAIIREGLGTGIPAETQSLHNKVSSLSEAIQRDFVQDVKPQDLKTAYDEMNQRSDELCAFMKKNKALDQLYQNLVQPGPHRLLVSGSLFDKLCSEYADTSTLLSKVPSAEETLKEWLEEAVGVIERNVNGENISVFDPSHYSMFTYAKVALFAASQPQIMAQIASMVPSVIGQMPGPSSLCVAVMQSYSKYAIVRALANPVGSKVIGDFYLKFLIAQGIFAPDEAEKITSITNRLRTRSGTVCVSLEELDELDDLMKKSFQAGPLISLGLCLLNVVLFFYTICNREDDTIQSWINLSTVSFFVNAGGAFSQFLQSYQISSRLSSRMVATSQVACRVLGFAAAAFALISSVQSFRDEYKENDRVGMVFSGIGVFGALLSGIGMLLFEFAGAAAIGGVALAPLGPVLMMIGAALGILASAYILFEMVVKGPNQTQFCSLLEYLIAAESVSIETGKENPAIYQLSHLKTQYEDIKTLANSYSCSFWTVDIEQYQTLYSIIRDWDQVAIAAGEVNKEDLIEQLRISHPSLDRSIIKE